MSIPWLPLSITVTTLTFILTLTHSSPQHDVVLLLNKIKPSIQGNTQNILLSSWNTSVPICQWRGLKWVFTNGTQLNCTPVSSPNWSNLFLSRNPSLHLLSLQLPSANLSGELPPELGDLSTLQSLYLSFNSITGSIPLELGHSSSLQDIDFTNNFLNGSVPVSIWNLCDKLISFRVHGNLLSGSIPEPGLPNASCNSLSVLDLGHNFFTGNIPEFITGFSYLKQLDLSDNKFYGSIPDGLSGLVLDKLNLSYNNFTGVLPSFRGSRFGSDVFEGNDPNLCGPPLKRCGRRSGVIAGVVISLMTGVVVFASLLIGYFLLEKM